jgi:DNA-binding GntR family transcriptional regulator
LDTKSFIDNKYIEQIRVTRNLSDFVYDAVKDSIISGRIPPGTKLKQLVLAKEMGISQQIVREGLKRLTATGLVIENPNRGFSVTSVPLKEQEDIFKLRAALEGFAMEEAINKIGNEDLCIMRELLPNTAFHGQDLPIEEIRHANREFHMIPVRATGNNHLVRMLDQLLDLNFINFFDNQQKEWRRAEGEDILEHAALLDALEKRDALRARQIAVDHILINKDLFVGFMNSIKKDKS